MNIRREVVCDVPDNVYDILSDHNIHWTGQEIYDRLKVAGYMIVPVRDLEALLDQVEINKTV